MTTPDDIKVAFEPLGVVTPILDEVLHNFPAEDALLDLVLENHGEIETIHYLTIRMNF